MKKIVFSSLVLLCVVVGFFFIRKNKNTEIASEKLVKTTPITASIGEQIQNKTIFDSEKKSSLMSRDQDSKNVSQSDNFNTMKQTYNSLDDTALKAEISSIKNEILNNNYIERANNNELSAEERQSLGTLLNKSDAANAVLLERSVKKIQAEMDSLQASLHKKS